ncbi:SDR family NAD(P)-dependent oxidoreductase [Novosphingobium sp. APW14]|uniref:SDR family NAD(P)-dependent oxidoreductase n=1 Tax=Novosphingobium sp. APW14 TaxID=3077237 RepID=UPI0028E06694|nr:SDR family NAD(P)-dependent oxidoreductase [Novosphingobium sp. APW14]MDT9012447.1 SDR family NAD(P)-dependent oxidoreductase [Novosphingobium sp. APW14]
MRQLEGRVCVVTGAARGLGQTIAAALGAAGGRLALCDLREDALRAAAAALRAQGCEVYAAACDVSDSAAVEGFFATVAEVLGPVDVLVNNAALVPGGPEDEARRSRHYTYLTTPEPRDTLGFTSAMSDAEWLKYWGVNVHGVFFCTRAALKQMEPRRYGRIVNIASIAGLSALSAHSPHYSATKGAVIAFTRAVAAEVAGANIFVNAVAPGGVATPQFDDYIARLDPEARGRLFQMIPAGRLGTMDEYAGLVVYLAGDGHYLAGQVISPNGGMV